MKNSVHISPRSIFPLAIAVFAGLVLFQATVHIFGGVTALVKDLLLALLLSIIFYYLLDPVVTRIEALGISRGIATFIVIVAIGVILSVTLGTLIPMFFKELENLQRLDVARYVNEINRLGQEMQNRLEAFLPSGVQLDIGEKVGGLGTKMVSAMVSFITSAIPQAIGLAVTVPFFTFFFLRDAGDFKKWLISFVPNRYFETALDVVHNIGQQMGAFIRGKFIESLIIAFSTSIILFIFGLKYNILLSLFAGLSNLIPYLGPVVGGIPIAIVGLTDLPSEQVLYLILAYFLFVQVFVDNMLVIPLLISRVSDLHPFVVLIAIIAGGKFLGIIGMFIGVPVVSVLKIIFEEIYYYLRYKGLREPLQEV